jgi:hypothetical protein
VKLRSETLGESVFYTVRLTVTTDRADRRNNQLTVQSREQSYEKSQVEEVQNSQK